jgi:hypothetical protein
LTVDDELAEDVMALHDRSREEGKQEKSLHGEGAKYSREARGKREEPRSLTFEFYTAAICV